MISRRRHSRPPSASSLVTTPAQPRRVARLLSSPWIPDFLSVAFDRAGDYATASTLNAQIMARAAGAHGATFGHVRAAHYACRRKEWEACRKLAQTVIDAWSVADAKVPAVDEMRALIATIPK